MKHTQSPLVDHPHRHNVAVREDTLARECLCSLHAGYCRAKAVWWAGHLPICDDCSKYLLFPGVELRRIG